MDNNNFNSGSEQQQNNSNIVNLSKEQNQQYNQQQYNGQQQQYNGQQQQYNGQQHNNQQQQFNQQQYNGQQQTDMVTPDKLRVEPTVACILSVLLAGLGQCLNGQLEKGLVIMLVGPLVIALLAVVTCGIGAILGPIYLALVAVDAYKCAQKLQSGQPIGKWEYILF